MKDFLLNLKREDLLQIQISEVGRRAFNPDLLS